MKKNAAVLRSFLIAGVFAVSSSFGQMTVTNGASFDSSQPMAPGSFATVFGQNLCAQTAAGAWIAPGQLPTSLGGCSVMVNGVAAMMQYASPGQMNFIVPPGAAPGQANVVVNNGSTMIPGSAMIGPAGPGVFSLNGMGMGEGAMLNGMMNWQTGPFSTTTSGQPTAVSMFVTGLDLSSAPVVMVAGVPAQVTWFGAAPGYAGLQQINVTLPAGMAGAGRVPVTVTSNGQTSNVTFMHVLPTAAMMQGMPGWGGGVMGENMPRGHEMSYLAFNPANKTALVTDENDDVVRIVSPGSNSTVATVTLPAGSAAHGIAVNPAGTLAAVTLSAKAAVALVDLSQNKVVSVVGTGYYPSRAAFSGTTLLVTNEGSGSVSVIDTTSQSVVRTVPVGFGPSGIAATPSVAVVANLQAGSLSLIDVGTFGVSTVALPAGARPYEVAISTAANKAVIGAPMSNGFFIVDLATKGITTVDTGVWNAMGPGAIAVNGSLAFIADMMTSSVTVADLQAGKVVKTFPVDPGPRALAVDSAGNRLLVLAEGTGTLDVVDLASYGIVARLNAGDTERMGTWNLPLVASITPASAAPGTTIALAIAGTNLQGVTDIQFFGAGSTGMGNGMGGGMGPGMNGGSGGQDPNIKVSGIQVSADGTRITASVQILSTAAPGAHPIRLVTGQGYVMGMMGGSGALFTITK